MAQVRICGVNVRIDRDPSSGVYYIYLEYENEEELPISLGKEIEPQMVYDMIAGFIQTKKIKCKHSFVKTGISQILQRLFREMGTEDQKTLDLKFFKWARTHLK